jgi:type II secretory pathway pseudopilin PulG
MKKSYKSYKPYRSYRSYNPQTHRAAYTLIEVLVAAAILIIAVAAAAALALATVTQEEINARIARCLNLNEQAARLYQLGLDPSVIGAILPEDPAVASHVFTTQSLPIPNLGTVEQANITLTFRTTPLTSAWSAGSWTGGESSNTAQRTSTITAIRPSLR